ncbi:metal-dependent transcriptional regulator [Flavisolibacter sp. BT320]|nr:metal-dependent transcriptional regulator [Flavisolibacter longurius]
MSHFGHQFEENYLKELYKLSQKDVKKVNNTALSRAMSLNPATVLEMVRKLSEKGLVDLLPDKSIQLTEQGRKIGLLIIRKHRLWEVFLVNKLQYKWSEVHDLAEQLEHVGSEDLINRLDEFLGFPPYDPHGDPIPDRHGKLKKNTAIALSKGAKNKTYQVVSFADTADSFLDYLSKLQIEPGCRIKITDRLDYDGSFSLSIQKNTIQVSEKVASNILVQPVS